MRQVCLQHHVDFREDDVAVMLNERTRFSLLGHFQLVIDHVESDHLQLFCGIFFKETWGHFQSFL